jgi:chloramphenicol-sensitive protein RarD
MDRKGFFAAAGAYIIWGFFPVYFKWLHSVPALEILAHRIVWSFLLLAGVLSVRKHWAWLSPALRNRRLVLVFLAAAILLSANWGIYIYAVNSGHVVESSLGYFINPLVYVLLGVIFLRERLRLHQWTAVGIATAGVAYLTWRYGQLPWIALSLALSFGFYGLLKKISPLGSTNGLTLETALMGLPATAYLLVLEAEGVSAFTHQGPLIMFLLLLAGPITALPLILFGYGAQRIPLYLVGLTQYIAPTIQFSLGVFLFNEPFSADRLAGFAMIWFALGVYSLGEYLALRARKRAIAAREEESRP